MNKVALLIVITLLTGCASAKFDCPRSKGTTCKSLYQVDQEVSALGNGLNENLEKKQVKLKSTAKKLEPKMSLTSENRPNRVPEVVGKIVILPYETKSGERHGQKDVHIVLQEAYWQ